MKVKLHSRTRNKGETAPFVIEIYRGYSKTDAGKIKHQREFQTLDYYLFKSPKNSQERQHNKEHKKLAEGVRSKMELDILNGKYGFASTFKGKTFLRDYFCKLRDQRKASKNNWDNWHGTYKYIEQYFSKSHTLGEIGVDEVKGFKVFLDEKAYKASGDALSQNTKYSYFNKFRACLNQAVEDGLISDNPAKRVKAFKMGEPNREYLTLDELQALFKTDCPNQVLKRAFLFSCLSGMRWGDIQQLTWNRVRQRENYWEVAFTQKKTKGVEYLPINDEARELMGKAGNDKEKVFVGLRYSSYMNVELSRWVLKAGIAKHITFHCARHTYATLQLTHGTDIYTVSKLLGHRELKTTQIYAKIVDQKKVDAALSLPKINV